jgi:hypothetical protein
MRVYKRRLQPRVEEAWQLTDAILKAFARTARAQGARFIVVYVPARFEVIDRDWELTWRQYDVDPSVWDRGLVAARLREIGSSGGFEVLDLTPALRAASRGLLGEPYYLYDGHWNARGHAAAARAIAAYLVGGDRLPCPRATPVETPSPAR